MHHYIVDKGIVSVVWPSAGIALAALLIGGKHYIWGVLLGTLLLNAISNNSPWVIIGITLANVVEVYLGYWLLSRKNLTSSILSTLPDYLRLIAWGGVASIAGALIGVLSLLLAGYIAAADYIDNFTHWWMGDALGIALLTSFALVWNDGKWRLPADKKRTESLLLLAITFIVGQVVFLNLFHQYMTNTPKGYWSFLFIAWIAIRVGARGVTLGVLMIAAQALIGAYLGVGFFAHDIALAGLHNYWAYILILSVIGMAISTNAQATNDALKALQLKESALNATANGIVITDANGRIEWINKAVSQLTGFSLTEAYGRNPRELVKSGKHDQNFYKLMWDTILANKVWRGAIVNRRKDGSFYDEDMTITPIADENNEITHFVAVKQDITEKIIAEKRIAYSETLFRGLFENMNSCVVIYNAVDGGADFIIKDINHSVELLEKVRREDVVGKHITEIFPTVKEFGLLAVMQRVLSTGEKESFPVSFYQDNRIAGWRDNRIYRLPLGEIVAIYDDVTARKQAEKALRESHESMNSLLQSMAEGAYGVDTNGNCTFVNQAFLKILGYDNSDEILGKHLHEMIHHSHADGRHYPATECRIYAAYQQHVEIHCVDEVFWHKNGHAVPVEYWSRPILKDGVMAGAIATFVDITERKRIEDKLRVSDIALTSISQGVLITNQDRITISVNEAFEVITGYKQEEVLGLDCRFLQGPLTDPLAVNAMHIALENHQEFSGVVLNYRKDGTTFWNELTISPAFDALGNVTHFIGITRDITERKQAEEQVRQLGFYDTLTKLPNRRLLNDRLSQTIAASKRTGRYGALMFLDLDNFKPLNDTHGHEVGDMLLIEAANRLTSCIREMDTVARFGGDEFVVMLGELDEDKSVSSTQATNVAEKIRSALSEQYQFTISHEGQVDKSVEHRCTGSIGIVVFNGSESSQDDLMKWADVAMYEAKDAGRNQIRFYGQKL